MADIADQHRVGRVGKSSGKGAACGKKQSAGRNGIHAAQQHAAVHALAHTVGLARTDVLPGIGGNGSPQRIKGAAKDHAQLVGCAHGGHKGGAQRVDGALQDHAANGRDRILQAHGQAHAAKAHGVAAAQAPFLALGLQNGKFFSNVEKAQKPRKPLRDHGGHRSAHHAHAAHGDEHNVQKNVQPGGQPQKHHGGAAVAHGAQHRGSHVIQIGNGNAPEQNADIGGGIGQNFFGGAHPAQDLGTQQAGADGQHRRKDHAQPHTAANIAPKLVRLLRAKGLRHGNGKAAAHPHAKTNDHKVDGTG